MNEHPKQRTAPLVAEAFPASTTCAPDPKNMEQCCRQRPCLRPGKGPCDMPAATASATSSEDWIYDRSREEAAVIGYSRYDSASGRAASEPHINWKHVDGPMLVRCDGRIHWLTWRERFLLWIGRTSAKKLDPSYRGE